MPRTTEQIHADAALTAALDAVHRAYHHDGAEGVLTKYLVLAHRVAFDDAGDAITTQYSNTRDNQVALPDVLGMVEHEAELCRHAITRADDDA